MGERAGSFPFFNVSQDHGVPYQDIMRIVQHFDQLYADEDTEIPQHSVYGQLSIAVFKAWAKERVRRKSVSGEYK